MERPTNPSCPSFWKRLMDEDFNHGIRIPRSFSNELRGRKSPCNYSLITENKKRSSNRSWRAKLVKKDHHFFLCKKSWPEFVKDHSLKYGDLLLFHLTDKKTFWVTPYGANGSKKKLDDDSSFTDDDDEDSDTSEIESDEDDDDDDDDDDDFRASAKHRQDRKHKMNKLGGNSPVSKKVRKSSDKDPNTDAAEEIGSGEERGRVLRSSGKLKGVDANSRKDIEEIIITSAEDASNWDNYSNSTAEKPYFIRTLKSRSKTTVVIPRQFARDMNLASAGEVIMRCEDGDGKKLWRVKIIERYDGRVDIAGGWSEFRQEYNIQIGETCRFSVINRRNTTTISVHVFRFHA